ncbi:MAG TPA: glycoside hydrolase family 2 TIM barrel-domain containing protein [Polyangia bacterium]|nr:glycoside hydrolase family 2 TIM barrel-domain containing protein [Polyangia bacterium]
MALLVAGLGGSVGCGKSGSSSPSADGGGTGGSGAPTDGPAGSGGNGTGSGGAGAGGSGNGGTDGGGMPMQNTGARTDTVINGGWKFKAMDVMGAEATAFDDTAWTPQDLPHTWNAMDGQDGPGTPMYRGIGWYRKHLMVSNDLKGQRLYLQFDGSNIITDVFVNGKPAGTHKGGFAAFRFDVTDMLMAGADNVIAAKVDNSNAVMANYALIPTATTAEVPPLSADFTFYGGIYRSVHLLATPPLAISPKDFGSSGVYVKQTNVSAASATLGITVKLTNATAAMAMANLKVTVLDAAGGTALSLTAMQAVPAGGDADAVLNGTLMNPHLWNGLADPYLYSVRVELLGAAGTSDAVTVPLGVRFFALDAATGFSLNGKYLDLHGINKHQDHKDKGWAISDDDLDADYAIVKELGATVIRLAHYQHPQHEYDITDKMGIVVWAETPVVNHINATPGFAANAVQQLTELIRQNINHPSIVFWSVGNETLLRMGPDPDMVIGNLAMVAKTEDPTRLVAYAANAGNENSPVDWHGDAHGFNEYQGWYGGTTSGFATWADGAHAGHPMGPIAVTEYGAGASLTEHTADPAGADTAPAHTPLPHYEEYQSYYHEVYWAAMSARPFLWGKFIWNGFDFASDTRMEGTTPGLNDKGLVTFDRQTKKDAFYLYKANWSSDPFVHINSRRFAALPKMGTTIRVYSNANMVDLKLNGTSLGPKAAANHIFVWTNVAWAAGANAVTASAVGAANVTDSVTWMN